MFVHTGAEGGGREVLYSIPFSFLTYVHLVGGGGGE